MHKCSRCINAISVRWWHRNQVFVQFNGLMQPLPRLMQTIRAVSNTQTIFAALIWHYFNCARRKGKSGWIDYNNKFTEKLKILFSSWVCKFFLDFSRFYSFTCTCTCGFSVSLSMKPGNELRDKSNVSIWMVCSYTQMLHSWLIAWFDRFAGKIDKFSN